MSGDLKIEPPSLEEIPLYEEDSYPVTLDDSIAQIEKLIAQQTDNTLEQETKKDQTKKQPKRVLAAFRPQKRLRTQSPRPESPKQGIDVSHNLSRLRLESKLFKAFKSIFVNVPTFNNVFQHC